MITNIKYYTFSDPITGVPTKDIGWDQTVVTHNFQSTPVAGGGFTILVNNTLTRVIRFSPGEPGAVEVLQAVYNLAPTAGESVRIRDRREAHLRILEDQAGIQDYAQEQEVISTIQSDNGSVLPWFIDPNTGQPIA